MFTIMHFTDLKSETRILNKLGQKFEVYLV